LFGCGGRRASRLFWKKRRDDIGCALYSALIGRDDLLRSLPHPSYGLRIPKEIPQCSGEVLLVLHHPAAMSLRQEGRHLSAMVGMRAEEYGLSPERRFKQIVASYRRQGPADKSHEGIAVEQGQFPPGI
jgi:hypothetical protein